MRFIILGASGLIGSHLYDRAVKAEIDVIGTYHNNPKPSLVRFDLRKDSLLDWLKPDDVVYLLSAYSNPSWIFKHPKSTRELNLAGTKKIIDEVFQQGARLVFMSSVEVFDGKDGNYNESSRPNPLNLYGRMKYEIERYLQQKKGNYCIVRTGWNVGMSLHHRCVIKLTYETLLRPDAKMAIDNTFSISDVKDTVEGLFRLSKRNALKICHLAGSPSVRRDELASHIISMSKYGEKMSYEPVHFEEIPYSEPRARLNPLDASLAVDELGMKFSTPKQIIREKVALLDRNFSQLFKDDSV